MQYTYFSFRNEYPVPHPYKIVLQYNEPLMRSQVNQACILSLPLKENEEVFVHPVSSKFFSHSSSADRHIPRVDSTPELDESLSIDSEYFSGKMNTLVSKLELSLESGALKYLG